ncbi:MAG TPA: class E sortase [Nitriliruptorales bacterium]
MIDEPRDEEPPDGGAGDEPSGFAMRDPVEHDGRVTFLGFLLDAFRRRRMGQFVLNGLVVTLFLSGAGMFAYPFFTDVYTEQFLQRGLEDRFETIEVQTFEEWEASITGESGTPLTKIAIPAIDIETLVVEGTSPAALRAGAGHYPNTPLPGQNGNVAIAGHRTTYGRPFNRLDEIPVGSEIWLVTPVGDYLYRTTSAPAGYQQEERPGGELLSGFVTTPKDWRIIEPTSVSSLTLTTCHPKGSASERLIVRAELAESFPAGYYDRTVAAPA